MGVRKKTVEQFALPAIYHKVEYALDCLERGDAKTAKVALRQILPAGYKHSFEKPKK